LREYRYEKAMESRLLSHEYIPLAEPPPAIGESPELEDAAERADFAGLNGSA
jgi:hypothetical protein